MEALPQAETPHSLTLKFAPLHAAWLEEMAAQGDIDVSTVLFWIIHTASRMQDTPWPLVLSGWSPFESKKRGTP